MPVDLKEKKKRSSFTAKTRNHNLYLFDKNRKKTILCHPILYFLARLKEKGQSPADWISQQTSEFVQVGEFGTYSKEEEIHDFQLGLVFPLVKRCL